ncbi:MAG: hypothetical protein R3Y62_00075 [Eubacteriales bacterium]
MPNQDTIHRTRQIQAEPIHVADVYAQPQQVMQENLHQEPGAAPMMMGEGQIQNVANAPDMEAPVQKKMDFKEKVSHKKKKVTAKIRGKLHMDGLSKVERLQVKHQDKMEKTRLAAEKNKAKYAGRRDKEVAANTEQMAMKINTYQVQQKNTNLVDREKALKKIGINKEVKPGEIPFLKEVSAIKFKILNSGGSTKEITRAMDKLGDFMRQLDVYNGEVQAHDVAIQVLIPNILKQDLKKGAPISEIVARKEIYVKQAKDRLKTFEDSNREIYQELLNMELTKVRNMVNLPDDVADNMDEDSANYMEFRKKAQMERDADSASVLNQINMFQQEIAKEPANVAELMAEQERLTFMRGEMLSTDPEIYYIKKTRAD